MLEGIGRKLTAFTIGPLSLHRSAPMCTTTSASPQRHKASHSMLSSGCEKRSKPIHRTRRATSISLCCTSRWATLLQRTKRFSTLPDWEICARKSG